MSVGRILKRTTGSAVAGGGATGDAGWTNITGGVGYQNGWSDYLAAGQFRKDANGRVWLNGVIGSGTDAAVFTLPVGYRPAQKEWASTVTDNTSQVIAWTIDTTGVVTVAHPGGSATGGTVMSGISFMT